jgi:HD-GYP domain-containing protein (c-di-GMP phosphodiesterase class II)
MAPLLTFAMNDELLGDRPFETKLVALHHQIHDRRGYESVGRVSVATFDEDTGMLSVYAFSDLLGKPLRLYSAPLAAVPSLEVLAKSGRVRVVQDLAALGSAPGPHTIAVRQNYRSSLTIPIRKGDTFYGFIFFNADRLDFFTEEAVERILPYGQLLAAITIADLDRIKTLRAAVQTTREIGNLRDDETAGHLLRMAAYVRLIAVALAPSRGLSERWVDMLTHFAPLHDVGKIGVPDNILLKPDRLTPDEFAIMRTHVDIGIHIVQTLLINFDVTDDLFGSLLLNVVACHHEMLDGTGYPKGLVGDAIPLEARIVVVGDIFDALTSERPYKRAWSIDEAFAQLRSLAGTKLDEACVAALTSNREQVLAIKAQFRNGVGSASTISA